MWQVNERAQSAALSRIPNTHTRINQILRMSKKKKHHHSGGNEMRDARRATIDLVSSPGPVYRNPVAFFDVTRQVSYSLFIPMGTFTLPRSSYRIPVQIPKKKTYA